MQTRYYKEYSQFLSRYMEFKVYGNGGKICYVFPSQDGRFYDYENFGMIDALEKYIDSGEITVVCPDGIDKESWSAFDAENRKRIEMQEKWFNYITVELVERIKIITDNDDKAIVTGCSMGAIHAAIFFSADLIYSTV